MYSKSTQDKFYDIINLARQATSHFLRNVREFKIWNIKYIMFKTLLLKDLFNYKHTKKLRKELCKIFVHNNVFFLYFILSLIRKEMKETVIERLK